MQKKERDFHTNRLDIYHLCVIINFRVSSVVIQYVNE